MNSTIVFEVAVSKKSFISVRMISFAYNFAHSNPFPWLPLQSFDPYLKVTFRIL